MTSLPSDATPDATPVAVVPPAPGLLVRTLLLPFNRAGAPRISDLGFDAGAKEGENDDEDDADGGIHGSSEGILSIPGERIGHISYGFEGERWRIRSLVWVVGQSRTGLALIEQAYQAGYRIAFDTMVATGENTTYALNAQDKIILLDIRATPEQQVSMLTLALAVASAALGGLLFDSSYTPPAAIAVHRMAMAYAHSLQIQVAFELRSAETLPEKAQRDAYWKVLSRQLSRMASGFAQMAVNDMALTQGSAMAGAIREFYGSPAHRARYEAEVINYFRSLTGNVLKDPKAMTAGFDPVNASYRLAFPSMVYAMTHDPKISLTDPVNLGARAVTVEAVAALQQARRTAGVKDRDPWQIPVADG